MADYIYLLENRLSSAQRNALASVREVARAKGLTSFLVGGAVRDLTSGSSVRDLDVVVQGSAPKLRRELEKAGAVVTGEHDVMQSLFLRFPGGVRLDIGSTLSLHFPKPGKPVAKPASLLEDLRRRDFTANAMALSLNEGSYGLLMDPLNGVADIENRELRLVSNYGFIEDPARMIRAARLMARLGWTMDEKTQARYETGKSEGYIAALSNFYRGYETEEIFHEEDPLRILKRLEAEGWMAVLAPFWTSAKVNVPELERLRETQTMLQMQGLQPDSAAASFPLLTAKLSAKEVATLKEGFPRQGFVAEIEGLEAATKLFAGQLASREAAAPSGTWRMLFAAPPEAVLGVAFSSKSPAIQAKLNSFATEWPQARTRMPYLLMQEMRIVPELEGYDDLLEKIFFELIDGRLTTPEEMRAFLEPFSPPAPPPPVNHRRLRAAKKESKPSKGKAKKPVEDALGADAAMPGTEAPETSAEGSPADPAKAPGIQGASPADVEPGSMTSGKAEAGTLHAGKVQAGKPLPGKVQAGKIPSGTGQSPAPAASQRAQTAADAPVKAADAGPVASKASAARNVPSPAPTLAGPEVKAAGRAPAAPKGRPDAALPAELAAPKAAKPATAKQLPGEAAAKIPDAKTNPANKVVSPAPARTVAGDGRDRPAKSSAGSESVSASAGAKRARTRRPSEQGVQLDGLERQAGTRKPHALEVAAATRRTSLPTTSKKARHPAAANGAAASVSGKAASVSGKAVPVSAKATSVAGKAAPVSAKTALVSGKGASGTKGNVQSAPKGDRRPQAVVPNSPKRNPPAGVEAKASAPAAKAAPAAAPTTAPAVRSALGAGVSNLRNGGGGRTRAATALSSVERAGAAPKSAKRSR